ncbi:MAG TPA: hypothetical protein VKV24_04185 [Casimicrobiaceae bacterium]|nr:hypothetical protein [Casimicrobiaceae bacterium]
MVASRIVGLRRIRRRRGGFEKGRLRHRARGTATGGRAGQCARAGLRGLAIRKWPRDRQGPAASNAAAWFRKAAERGHAFAQYDLGVLCLRGHGVPESRVEAYKWIYLAAQRMQGDARAKAIETLDRVGAAMSRNERDHAMPLAQQWFRANPCADTAR